MHCMSFYSLHFYMVFFYHVPSFDIHFITCWQGIKVFTHKRKLEEILPFTFLLLFVSKTNSTHYFHLEFTHVLLVPTFLFYGTLQSTNGSILGFGLLFIIDQLRYLINLSLVSEIMSVSSICILCYSIVISNFVHGIIAKFLKGWELRSWKGK